MAETRRIPAADVRYLGFWVTTAHGNFHCWNFAWTIRLGGGAAHERGGLWECGLEPSTKAKQAINHQRTETSPPSLTVADQTSAGYTVVVAALRASDGPKAETAGSNHGGGYVAIVSDLKDKPAAVLGYAR